MCVCGFHFYSHKCFLMQGVIDVDKEVTKLEGKKDTLGKQLKKLQDASTVTDYQTKVPEEVRTQNSEKVSPVICSLLYISFISHTTFFFFVREREHLYVFVCHFFLQAQCRTRMIYVGCISLQVNQVRLHYAQSYHLNVYALFLFSCIAVIHFCIILYFVP